MDNPTTIIAHEHDAHAKQFAPQTWRAPTKGKYNHQPHTTCSYCGSLSPAGLVAAIQAGATLELADMKYGWPHKFYVDGIPNIYAGEMECLSSTSLGRGKEPTPEDVKQFDQWELEDGFWRGRNFTKAPATTHGKFYTLHLKDATAEERVIIERAFGIQYVFVDTQIAWSPFVEPQEPVLPKAQADAIRDMNRG